MKIRLMKKIEGEWYEDGNFSEQYFEQLVRAYDQARGYADEVKIEIIDTDKITCGDCAHLYVKGMQGFCPYMNGWINVNDYCSRAMRKEADDE